MRFYHFLNFIVDFVAKPVIEPKPSQNPCVPSPCGPNSQCRAIGDSPACSCLPNYLGRAPNCRPECVISSECPSNLACINERCSDPCIGACGIHTYCTVLNHNSVCQCENGYTGDPFSSCSEIPKCKNFSSLIIIHTQIVTNRLFSSILYIKTICPFLSLSVSLYFFLSISMNPWTTIEIHKKKRIWIALVPPISDEVNPCSPSPCGANAVCKERNNVGSCLCLPEYFGDPYTGCRPECVQNSECDRTKACINNRCKDPCPGVCGINASKFPGANLACPQQKRNAAELPF